MRLQRFILALVIVGLLPAFSFAQGYTYNVSVDTQITAYGTVTCIAGVIMDASTNAATVAIKDGTSTGTTKITLKDLATDNGQSKQFTFPGYIWCKNGAYIDETNCTSVFVVTVVPDGSKLVKLTYSGSGSREINDPWQNKLITFSTARGLTQIVSDRFAYDRLRATDKAYWAIAAN